MNLKEWFAAAQHCGVIYFTNKASEKNLSAKLMFYTIVNGSQGPRLERAWPDNNGQYDEKLAKKIGFRLNVNASEPHFFVNGSGFSRSEKAIDSIFDAIKTDPNQKRPFITVEQLQTY